MSETGQVVTESKLLEATEAPDVPGTPGKLPKPQFGWLVKVDYKPDAESSQEALQTESGEYAKRFGVRESIKTADGKTMSPQLDAVLLSPRKESGRWQPVRISTTTALKAYFNSEVGQLKRTIESVGGFDSDIIDGRLDATALLDQEFIPLMGGPFYKQLYLYDYLKMNAIAFNLVNHNALAAAAVKMLMRFTLGRGVSFNIKDDQTRRLWEEFWERTNTAKKSKVMARDITWQGELMLRYYEEKPGYTTYRVIDPSTCWEIVTDPEDIEKVYYYHFQWPTPYQLWTAGNIPISKYIIQQIPPTNVQHVKINVSSMEKRGRSDLLPGMPWLKRFDDFYNGATLKEVLQANLVWRVKVKGDQADIDALKANPELTILPPPGGVWLENESVELSPLSASVQPAVRGGSSVGQQIAAIFATSINMPSEYFNIEGTSGGARATALVRTDPAVKTIEDRQQLLREDVYEDMYNRVLTNAIIAGRLPKHLARKDPETLDALPPEEQRTLNNQRRLGRKLVAIR
jgi:hypothetical protein